MVGGVCIGDIGVSVVDSERSFCAASRVGDDADNDALDDGMSRTAVPEIGLKDGEGCSSVIGSGLWSLSSRS